MSGFDDGKNRLMRPGDGDWTAWRNGGMQRHNEEMMADMTARHHAASEQLFSQMYSSSTPPAIGYVGPIDKRTARILWIVAFVLIGSGIGLIAYDRSWDSQRAAAQDRVAQQRNSDQREADRIWLPVLERALLNFDARRDLAAIEQAQALSGCHRESLARLMSGGTQMLGCLGDRQNPSDGPVRSSVHFDRFVVTYDTRSPVLVENRLTVMALNPQTRNAGRDLGDDSPPVIAQRALGAAAVDRLIASKCIVIAGGRVARGQPFVTGPGRPTIAATNRDVVSIACPEGGRLQIRATRTFRD